MKGRGRREWVRGLREWDEVGELGGMQNLSYVASRASIAFHKLARAYLPRLLLLTMLSTTLIIPIDNCKDYPLRSSTAID